jgi:hypothetical protein
MTAPLGALVLGLAVAGPVQARVVVFQQPGFPTLESEEVPRETLSAALEGRDVGFVDLEALEKPGSLEGARLLVLPYGSAFPADAWAPIREYLEGGGNLLALGGRPLWIPIHRDPKGAFQAGRPQDTYWRLLAAVQATEVPQRAFARFAWDAAFPFRTDELRARRVFTFNSVFVGGAYAAPESSYRGLGFLLGRSGERLAAPVTRLDFTLTPEVRKAQGHGRLVMLNFEPEAGYWASAAGRSLVRETAEHAVCGPALLWVELPRASLLEGESAQVVVHLQDWRAPRDGPGPVRRVTVELRREDKVLETQTILAPDGALTSNVVFATAAAPGLYEVHAAYERDGSRVEAHDTGFWRRDPTLLASGSRLSAGPTYLRKDGVPFIPVGVNHWVDDSVWSSFPDNANALEWDRDFGEMAARGLTFVRTGIWGDRLRLMDSVTGGARETVLRNIEAFLLTAGRHGLQVQFTLFAFEPQTLLRSDGPGVPGPGRNPYTDPVAVEAQKTFVRSIATRFKDVPFLSFDLINEPSFSNPRIIFRGNQPNADPSEVDAWNEWLQQRYGDARVLADAWGVVPEEIPEIGHVPVPAPADLVLTRNGNPRQVRAFDYNLFAQDAFSHWVAEMVGAIRATGSAQIAAVGQDEGGITNRLLNQFYGGAGVALTSLHNWWNDDALLWDAVAAKRPGMPNLVGETGPQPSVDMEGRLRWDETQGLGLVERKLALSMAAGNGGAAAWIWSRRDPFRFGRQDGTTSLWIEALGRLGSFAREAGPHLSDARQGDVALVLPQSLQLSVFADYALEAQQKCVRALYHYARASAYAVGEHQIELLGDPKVILLPAPWVLSQGAWDAVLGKVRRGATLLVTGRFDLDEHFRPTDRLKAVGLDYAVRVLATRENPVRWPGGGGIATFSGNKTTFLEAAALPAGATFAGRPVGRGRILFFTLPLELGDDLRLLGDVYRWALEQARVTPLYRTPLDDPGILICPTALETGTLYVLTSESSSRRAVVFTDVASGKELQVVLDPGRAALRLVTRTGQVVASYDPAPAPGGR